MADITQKLPPEFFIRILHYLSIPDVLRVKQVSEYDHTCSGHDSIVFSRWVEEEADDLAKCVLHIWMF